MTNREREVVDALVAVQTSMELVLQVTSSFYASILTLVAAAMIYQRLTSSVELFDDPRNSAFAISSWAISADGQYQWYMKPTSIPVGSYRDLASEPGVNETGT
jgi:hypothetical protein